MVKNIIKRPLAFTCLAVCALLFLVVKIRPAPAADHSQYEGKAITLEGEVYKKETVTQKRGPVLVLYVKLAGERVMCYLPDGQAEPEMGSRVRLSGKLAAFEQATNPGQFDAYSYYQILGISYRLNQAKIIAKTKTYNKLAENAYRFRGYLSQKISQSLPEKEASVMQTMLLGEKSSMDKELKALYQRNGIAHILAISGLHISMLGMGLYKLLRKGGIPMRLAAVLSAGAIALYGMMTGSAVSAVRAIVMFSLHMAAILVKRTYDMLTALAVAAALILLGQPLYLNHSGFVFSFGCVLGIGVVLPALTEDQGQGKSKNDPAALFLLQKLSGGLAMSVITLPVYLWFYYQFPIYSIFLNLLIIPMMSLLMAAGLLMLSSSILCPFMTPIFALFIKAILGIYEGACKISDSLPGNLLTPGKPESWQIAAYLLALLSIVILKKKVSLAVRWGIVALAALLVATPLGNGLMVTFLDVGQGDCICIENSHGNTYLVDGGSSSASNVGKYRIIPFLKSQGLSKLEAVIATHPDEDHCNGLMELLAEGEVQGIKVQNLVLPDIPQDSKNGSYLELEQQAAEAAIPISYISRGQKIVDGNLALSCLHPVKGYPWQDANEYSVVLALSYGDFSAVLTGDVEGDGEQMMVEFLQEKGAVDPLTVLKVAHHGSRYSTPDKFLQLTRPTYALISAGEGNSYGHPHEELLKRLEEAGCRVLSTQEQGAVGFWTDGRRVKIRSYRSSHEITCAEGAGYF